MPTHSPQQMESPPAPHFQAMSAGEASGHTLTQLGSACLWLVTPQCSRSQTRHRVGAAVNPSHPFPPSCTYSSPQAGQGPSEASERLWPTDARAKATGRCGWEAPLASALHPLLYLSGFPGWG